MRSDIDKCKNIIDNLINKLNSIKNIIDYFYNINKRLYDSIKNKQINYELLYSCNNLNESDIINDINYIINNDNNNRYE